MKGAIAKENVAEIIKKAFGQNYLGELDKKYYVSADDGGEKVQIAISLTCPKNEVDFGGASAATASSDTASETPVAAVEVTEQETETLAELLKKLGL